MPADGEARPPAFGTASTLGLLTTFPAASYNSDVAAFGTDQQLAPPDTQLAAGPSDVAEAVNDTLTVWSKTGSNLAAADLNTFFTVPSGYRFTDPRVAYDAATSRWLLSGLAFDNSNDSIVYLAVSTTGDPTGIYYINTVASGTAVVADQPKLGFDSDVAVLSWNDYSGSSLTFSGEETWVLQKSDLLAGTAVSVNFFGPDTTRNSVVPVQSLSATSTEYLVYNNSCGTNTIGACRTGTSALGLVAITGTPDAGNVAWSETDPAIAPTTVPPAADQPGATASVATDDDRFLTATATAAGAMLYVSGNDGCVPGGDTVTRPCARLIDVSLGASPAVTLDGDLGYNGGDLYYPAVAPDASADVFIAATFSSTTTYPQATGLSVAAGASSFSAIAFQAGSGANTDGRWGDYSGAAVDPSNPANVWLGGEYAPMGGVDWGTAIGELTLAGPHFGVSAPSSATANSPINVTVTAKDRSGSTDTGYTGTVHFTSTDGAASLPANYTFTGADAGVHIVSVTLRTSGNQTVTATDTVTSSNTGTSGTIAVMAAPVFRPQGVGQPAVTVAPDGTQLVFWQGAGGHLIEAWWNGRWNGPVDWTAANGWAPSLSSAPSVALAPDGTQIVFWKGPSGHLFEAWWHGTWNGPVDWSAANGWAASLGSAPSVTFAPDGTQLIFWQGAGGHLDEAWWNGHWNGPVDWTAAYGWGSPLNSAPSVAIQPNGTQLIFWQGAGGHLIEAWWNAHWNGPVDWTAAFGWGAPVASAPSVALASGGTTQLIFWRGASGHLIEAWWNGHWNGPVDWTAAYGWGAPLSSAPSVAIQSDGTQLIFWQGAGGQLDEVWWQGHWNGPVDWSA